MAHLFDLVSLIFLFFKQARKINFTSERIKTDGTNATDQIFKIYILRLFMI